MKVKIIGKSMMPTLKENAVYEMQKVKVKDVVEGDIIVFFINNMNICHRVNKKIVLSNGVILFKTQGDNCKYEDAFLVRDYMIMGRVVE